MNVTIKVAMLILYVTFEKVYGSEKNLQEDLMNKYNRLIRPVKKSDEKLLVKFGIRLIQILDMVIIFRLYVC